MQCTANGFTILGSKLATKSNKAIDERSFKAFYGVSAEIVADVWAICDRPPKTVPKHLLWTLMCMKLYNSLDVMIILLDTTKPTFLKWVWLWTEAMALASPKIILWEKRNRNVPANVWCRVSVDGTDFAMDEPFPMNKKWMSHKFKKSGLKYEIGISIYSGDIVWIYGPHRGAKHDLTIFKEAMKDDLDQDEIIEADRGYRGAEDFIRCPDDCETKDEFREKSRIRCRHESCNGRFKIWGILRQAFRVNDRKKHGLVFRAIVMLVQLDIDNGNCLFGCEPATQRKTNYLI